MRGNHSGPLPAGADYIVVGSGSAGAIVARRLADSGASVVLLEAGRQRHGVLVSVPGMVGAMHAATQLQRRVTWPAYSTPQRHLYERTLPQSHGRLLGGSSVINGMAFVRGNRQNFDDWAAEGNAGWSYQDVLPYFKKLETFEDGNTDYRGGDGPVRVTRARNLAPASEAFLDALTETAGVKWNDDYNGATQEGVAALQENVFRGRRQGTDICYLQNAPGTLQIVTGVVASRILIERGRATGVEVLAKGGTVTIRADCEVIMSAGALGSPRLLMISGVGHSDHLRSLGITPQVDLPVGDNLHDHLFVPLSYTIPTGRVATPGRFATTLVKELRRPDSTFLAQTLFEAVGFVHSNLGGKAPDLQVFVLPLSYPANQDAPGYHSPVSKQPSLTLMPTVLYPKSRGTLRLQSSDPLASPLIDPEYGAESADIDVLVAGMELVRETMTQPGLAKDVRGELLPGPSHTGKATLSEVARRTTSGVYHPVGTCRMGIDERAVVDPQLRVRGIDGLRVVDASIIPSIIGGNTNATVMMIAERASDLLLGEGTVTAESA